MAASSRASSAAKVLAKRNVASKPVSVAVMSINLPSGFVRSCSSNNLTGFEKSMLSFSNTVKPALVEPCSSQVTILPEIVRLFVLQQFLVASQLEPGLPKEDYSKLKMLLKS